MRCSAFQIWRRKCVAGISKRERETSTEDERRTEGEETGRETRDRKTERETEKEKGTKKKGYRDRNNDRQ